MTDTVTRLMGLADEFALRCFHHEHAHNRELARQALEAELVRLFTPLSEGTVARYLREVEPDVREDMCASSFCEGIRFAEKHRGIGGES